jgi:hypothetical protein
VTEDLLDIDGLLPQYRLNLFGQHHFTFWLVRVTYEVSEHNFETTPEQNLTGEPEEIDDQGNHRYRITFDADVDKQVWNVESDVKALNFRNNCKSHCLAVMVYSKVVKSLLVMDEMSVIIIHDQGVESFSRIRHVSYKFTWITFPEDSIHDCFVVRIFVEEL